MVRMIGNVVVRIVTDNTAAQWSLGVAVSTRDAFAAGALPEPFTDLVDWYYLRAGYERQEVNRDNVTYDFDIRTARAVRGLGRTLVAVFENSSLSDGSINVVMNYRLLLKMS